MRSHTKKCAVITLTVVLAMTCGQSASAQTFKKVNVKGGATITQVASGGMSVWALAANGNPYIYKGTQFVLANTISLTQIAVGGGNVRQKDTVWALDSAGNIYNAVKSGTSWVFNQKPGVLSFIAVGIGYQDKCHPYEVWGLNPSALIYRFNYCLGNWENIPGTLQTLSVGGGQIWGVNGNSEIYRFDFPTLSFQLWTGASATQVAVGPNGVWVLGDGSVLQTLYYAGPFYIADGGNLRFVDIRAGGNGLWALHQSDNQVYRLDWRGLVPVPGAIFASISVGSGGGVWGINSSGQVYAFSTP